jgi:hypothetical protein
MLALLILLSIWWLLAAVAVVAIQEPQMAVAVEQVA